MKYRLLIVARNDEFNRGIVKTLWDEGLEVRVTSSIQEALNELMTTKPHFVMLDYDHPQEQSILKMSELLPSKFEVATFAYVEQSKPSSLIRLNSCELPVRMAPPISAELILKHTRKMIRSNAESLQNRTIDEINYVRPELRESGKDAKLAKDEFREKMEGAMKAALAQVMPTPHTSPAKRAVQCSRILFSYVQTKVKKGFVVLGSSADVGGEFDEFWLGKFCRQLEIEMKQKGEDVVWQAPHDMEVKDLDVVAWGRSLKAILLTTANANDEAHVGFFEYDLKSVELKPSEHFGDHYEVAIEDFYRGAAVDFPVKCYLAENNRLLTLISPGSTMTTARLQKLKENKIDHLLVEKNSWSFFLRFRYVCQLRKSLENYHFESMAQDIRSFLDDESGKQRAFAELDYAKEVQKSIFPKHDLFNESVHVQGYNQQASEIGGDWYDYHLDHENQLVRIWIGDATGHGAPAALVTTAAKSASSMLQEFPELPLTKLMSLMNRSIRDVGGGKVLMTFFLMNLDLRTGILRYINASHTPPFHFPKFGTAIKKSDVQILDDHTSPRLGQSYDSVFKECQIQLNEGDRVVAFTDGVVELENETGDLWGERKFLQVLMKGFTEDPEIAHTMKLVKREITQHRGMAALKDDVSYVMLAFKKKAGA